MPRYFIKVSYKGTRYSGFQVQQNANTIQSELEKALEIFFRKICTLTGSSRTDAGVHALQNYFHFDSQEELFDNPNNSFENNTGLRKSKTGLRKSLYSLNSILPDDIVIHNIGKVKNSAHSRYDAVSRQYKYQLYQSKNPFYKDIAYYYPYSIDIRKLQLAAEIIVNTNDFKSFSKRKTQVNNFICSIHESDWIIENDLIIYNVVGNRFLRGMVRGLVGTMLKVGSGKIRLQQFEEIIKNRDCTKADFSVPPQGLFLVKVIYPHDVFVI